MHRSTILPKLISTTVVIFLFVIVTAAISSRTPILGFHSYVVLSGSMEPTLPTGSLIFVRPSKTYQLGNIIAFKNKSGQIITHRIVAKDLQFIKTMGDANSTPDTDLLRLSQITGKHILTLPLLGYISHFLRSPLGFIICLILPSLVFIISQLLLIKSEIEKSLEKKILKKYHLPVS